MSETKSIESETPAVVAGAARGSATVENIITAPTYGYDGIDMMALLAAVMERYKDIPENEKRAGVQWLASKYGVGG